MELQKWQLQQMEAERLERREREKKKKKRKEKVEDTPIHSFLLRIYIVPLLQERM